MAKVWIHVTDYINWMRPPVGTIRVEQKIIKWCTENLPNVGFFIYDRNGKFTSVDLAEVIAKLNNEVCVERHRLLKPLDFFQEIKSDCNLLMDECKTEIPKDETAFKRTGLFRLPCKEDFNNFSRKLKFAFYHLFISFFNSTYQYRINVFLNKATKVQQQKEKMRLFKLPRFQELKYFFRLLFQAFYQLLFSFLNETYREKLLKFVKFLFKKPSSNVDPTWEDKNPLNYLFHPFNNGDTILCAGGTWNFAEISLDIHAIKKNIDIKFFAICHDLIPIKLPHLSVVEKKFFANYLKDLSLCADHIFCISKSTERDYKEFLSSIKVSVPSTSIIKIGSEVYEHEAIVSPALQPLLERDFILFVSTIECRKNHACLYRALLYLLDQGYQNLPVFVFVGLKGWGVADLLQDLESDQRIKKHIMILAELDDVDLSVLYKKCLFTVYPSFYEGWGLPLAEALAYGKFVISSSSSSLPEVGGEFVDYVSPYDSGEWGRRIAFYLNNRDELNKKETMIREQYRKNLWHDCCVEIFGSILGSVYNSTMPGINN